MFFANVDTATYDEIEMILAVNGLRYRETGSYGNIESSRQSPVTLDGSVLMELVPGEYSVSLHWKRVLGSVRPWYSSSSFLDGFSMGRVLAVVGEWSVDSVSIYNLKQLHPSHGSDWSDVGDSVLQFALPKATSVAFSYNLPLSQSDNPSLSTLKADSWQRIKARVVVDGVAYRHLSSFVDGSVRGIKSARATMLLPLAAGSHTARLQWQNLDGNKWKSVSLITDAASSYASIFLSINTWSNDPHIVAPDRAQGYEDKVLKLDGVSIVDTNGATQLDYGVTVHISMAHGSVSLDSTPGITFASGNGVRDQYLLFSGSLSSVNAALASLTYQSFLNWYGEDVLTLKIVDQSSTGFGSAATEERQVVLNIKSVNDYPQLTVPADLVMFEDTEASIFGVVLRDVDVVGPTNETSADFEVHLSVMSGAITLSTMEGLKFIEGTGESDQRLRFRGSLFSCNAALFEIKYTPDKDFNTQLHPEVLDINVRDINYRDGTVTEVANSVRIHVQSVDDVARVVLSNAFSASIRGYLVARSVGATIPDAVFVRLSVMSTIGRIRLDSSRASLPNGVVKAPLTNEYSSSIDLRGPADAVLQVVNSVIYSREPASVGFEVIFLTTSYFEDFSVAERSAVVLALNTEKASSLLIQSVTPPRGIVFGGTEVSVVGRGFALFGDLWCRFGRSPLVPALISSDIQLTCKVPSNNGSHPLRGNSFLMVTNGKDCYSNPIPFTYIDKWTVEAIVPSTGTRDGKSMVIVKGDAFPDVNGTTCLFGEAAAPARFLSASRIVCDVPEHGDSTVTVPFNLIIDGQASIDPLTFTYTGEYCLQLVY